jgi:hypothetical protein
MDMSSFDANYADTTLDAENNATRIPTTDCPPALTLRDEKRQPPNLNHDGHDPGSPVPIPELKVISQPDAIHLNQILTYSYRPEVRGFARIYVVDSGADVSLQVR